MNKPLVIYHANCADGFGAAFAAWTVLGDDATYLPWKYSHDFLATCKEPLCGRDIYILDFSLPKEQMEYLFAEARRVVWLDHHKTAFEMWCGEYQKGLRFYNFLDVCAEIADHVVLDDNKSGAMLAWEYFHPGTEIPMLIRHIDDYDRWQFKIEGTKAFNKALWCYAPWNFEQWKEKFLPCDMGNPKASFEATAKYTFMLNSGSAILRSHDQNVQGVVKAAARECSIQLPDSGKSFLDMVRLNGLAANCPPHLTSDVGHELAVQSGTFGLCWTLGKKGMIANCSLRSNGDYDVSAIAKSFGGGGHRNAAGFEVPIETLLGWLI